MESNPDNSAPAVIASHPPGTLLPGMPTSSPAVAPVPVKPVTSTILTADLPKPEVFPESPNSENSAVNIPQHSRARQFTLDSNPSSAEMETTSTAATSPVPLGSQHGTKMDGHMDSFSHSNDAVLRTPTASRPGQRADILRSPNGLNQPKTEHMQWFLNNLPPGHTDSSSSFLGIHDDTPTRQRSPGRVSAVVQEYEEAHKRSSMQSERDSARLSQEIRRPDATSNPGATGKVSQPAGSQPEDPAMTPADSVKTRPDAEETSSGHSKSGVKGSIRFLLKKIRTNSGDEGSGKNAVKEGKRTRQDSDTTVSSSAPVSLVIVPRFTPPREPPMENGKDARNEATYNRDLQAEFENRMCIGRHEHPIEGSAALRQGTNIRSMGVKQLFRSISERIRSSSKNFKKLVLRRARTIPNQFSAVVHGQVPPHLPPDPESKYYTRAQRQKQYQEIITGVLPTFGDRVSSPPPIPPSSPKPDATKEPGFAYLLGDARPKLQTGHGIPSELPPLEELEYPPRRPRNPPYTPLGTVPIRDQDFELAFKVVDKGPKERKERKLPDDYFQNGHTGQSGRSDRGEGSSHAKTPPPDKPKPLRHLQPHYRSLLPPLPGENQDVVAPKPTPIPKKSVLDADGERE